jgi:hypothetical protein
MSQVILEFIGLAEGAQVFRHPVTKRSIRAGRHLAVRFVTVTTEEADYFLSLGMFRNTQTVVQVNPVSRKDAPKRIEPVVEIDERQNTFTPQKDTPKAEETNMVSFESTTTGDIAWMSVDNEDTADVTTNLTTEPEDVDTTDAVKSDKVRRGRPKN